MCHNYYTIGRILCGRINKPVTKTIHFLIIEELFSAVVYDILGAKHDANLKQLCC